MINYRWRKRSKIPSKKSSRTLMGLSMSPNLSEVIFISTLTPWYRWWMWYQVKNCRWFSCSCRTCSSWSLSGWRYFLSICKAIMNQFIILNCSWLIQMLQSLCAAMNYSISFRNVSAGAFVALSFSRNSRMKHFQQKVPTNLQLKIKSRIMAYSAVFWTLSAT